MANSRVAVGKPDGSTYVSDNGYHYTKQDGRFRLTHHILMEEKLGRPLRKGERVYFSDGNRRNLNKDNIEVRTKRIVTFDAQLAALYTKRDDILAMIEDVENQKKLAEQGQTVADALEGITALPQAQDAYKLKDFK